MSTYIYNSMSISSINTRHTQNTEESTSVFIDPERMMNSNMVEVVCSSARHRMDQHSSRVAYSLLSHTLSLNGELVPSWPSVTSIHCWHCCHPFSTTPISVPRIFSTSRTYEVYGVFCSLNCAKKFVLDRGGYDQTQVLMQLNEICVSVFGLPANEVYSAKPAPPRFFLTMFGGHLTIEEFRAHSLYCHTLLIMPPFVSHAMIMESYNTRNVSKRNEDIVEPLREGHHILRGLRRPTFPITAPPTPVVATQSRFVEFMKTRDCSGVADARPKKSRKKDKDVGRGVVDDTTTLNCFLTS